MIKYLILFVVCTSVTFGNWYPYDSNIYSNAAKTGVNRSCIRKTAKYKLLLENNKNSKYYQWKYKTWLNICNKELKTKGK